MHLSVIIIESNLLKPLIMQSTKHQSKLSTTKSKINIIYNLCTLLQLVVTMYFSWVLPKTDVASARLLGLPRLPKFA